MSITKLKAQRWLIGWGFFAAIGLVVETSLVFLILRTVLDVSADAAEFQWSTSVPLFVLLAIRIGCSSVQTVLANRHCANRAIARRADLVKRMLTVPWEKFQQWSQADLRGHLTVIAERRRGAEERLLENASRLLLVPSYMLGLAISGFVGLATLILLAGIPAGIVLIYFKRGVQVRKVRKYLAALGKFGDASEGMISLQRAARGAHLPAKLHAHATRLLDELIRSEITLRKFLALDRSAKVGLFGLTAGAVAALGIWMTSPLVGIAVGLIAVRALVLMGSTMGSLMQDIRSWQEIEASFGSLMVEPGAAPAQPTAVLPFETLRFEGVSYRYPNGRDDAIKQADIALEPGDVLVVEGVSGSGKSTLADIVAGLLIPASGQATLDGQQVALADAALRLRAFSMIVPPTTGFVGKSIQEEIEILGIDAASVSVAFEMAEVDFLAWPDDTSLELDFRHLSHGQMQRLGLARALMVDPYIMVVDEALSGLDRGRRAKIIDSLVAARSDKITIFVTHDADDLGLAGKARYLNVQAGLVRSHREKPQGV